MCVGNFFKRWSWLICGLALLMLPGEVVYSQNEGGRVLLDITSGSATVTPTASGLKNSNAAVDRVWISVSFSDPTQAHAIIIILNKGEDEAEVSLGLEDRYARGSTTEFRGKPVLGEWKIHVKGENPSGIGIYLTIDCLTGPAPSNTVILLAPVPAPLAGTAVRPVPVPAAPTSTPATRPAPPASGGDINITPEMQYQALTRLLIRKGIITAPELANEIQRVARER